MKGKPRKRRKQEAGDVAPPNPGDSAPPTAPAGPGRHVFLCDLCGSPMLERHCRLVCPQCGYQRDCSDP